MVNIDVTLYTAQLYHVFMKQVPTPMRSKCIINQYVSQWSNTSKIEDIINKAGVGMLLSFQQGR